MVQIVLHPGASNDFKDGYQGLFFISQQSPTSQSSKKTVRGSHMSQIFDAAAKIDGFIGEVFESK
jgi:hypothetical protein